MKQAFLKVHPKDNVLAALQDLKKNSEISLPDDNFMLHEDIPAKHKFTIEDLNIGESIIMYGVLVGKALQFIKKGSRISVENTEHASAEFGKQNSTLDWQKPDVTNWKTRTFNGFHRSDGKVGTMNYWLVIPLVFCENRNVEVIKEALEESLGYAKKKAIHIDVESLIDSYKNGASEKEILEKNIVQTHDERSISRLFPNVDGIKFLTHQGGCGGTREDSETLCRLLAGYICHPNVAGATVLSLGCQNAQIPLLKESIKRNDPDFIKPLFIFEQQDSLSEKRFIEEAVKHTFVGLIEANKNVRKEAGIEKLVLGLECGGSDGFSGISANPALGYTSDLLVSCNGTAVLSEFPELNGVEQELINRCTTETIAKKFGGIMKSYSDRAEAVGSGFKNNPSPGNIKDGLITDAIKSAGAAKKGGTSPVTDVLDYTEIVKNKGLNLLCTPGNDVESTTGLAGSGSNIIVFTTGLGTPTGNPITPVIKMSSNNKLFQKMNDIIDFNAGSIISGEDTIESIGESLLEYIIKVASGEAVPHAVRLGQDDFIPWKRGVSL